MTITKSGSGKYFCAAAFGYEAKGVEPAAVTAEKTLGLNYSPARFYVDSQGESPVLPDLAGSREPARSGRTGLSPWLST